jgi:hypothetical protein
LAKNWAHARVPGVRAPLSAQNKHAGDRIEPAAGEWKTWVISSGKDYRVPRPPSPSETQAELRALGDLIGHNDQQIAAQIAYWDAGAPAYRWIDLISNRLLAATPTTAYPHRVYAYVAMAMYDATIAAWESKYYYNRLRPSEMDHKLPTAVDVPDSPSYPSEHAAAAQAAATVLAASTLTGTSGPRNWTRGSSLCSRFRATQAIRRTIPRFRQRGRKCSRISSRTMLISYGPLGKRQAIRVSGVGSITRWTMSPASTSERRWPVSSSTGPKTMGLSSDECSMSNAQCSMEGSNNSALIIEH